MRLIVVVALNLVMFYGEVEGRIKHPGNPFDSEKWPFNVPQRKTEKINECLKDNGGCAHNCNNIEGGHKCSCKPGFKLQDDGKTCNFCRTSYYSKNSRRGQGLSVKGRTNEYTQDKCRIACVLDFDCSAYDWEAGPKRCWVGKQFRPPVEWASGFTHT